MGIYACWWLIAMGSVMKYLAWLARNSSRVFTWFPCDLQKACIYPLTYQNIFWGPIRQIDPSYQASHISHKTHPYMNLRFLASPSPIFSIRSLNTVLCFHLRYEIEIALDLLFFGSAWLHSWELSSKLTYVHSSSIYMEIWSWYVYVCMYVSTYLSHMYAQAHTHINIYIYTYI